MNTPRKSDADARNRGVVPGPRVHLSHQAVQVVPPRRGAAAQPRVELLRDGEVVRTIEVICTCGKRIRVRCIYENEG